MSSDKILKLNGIDCVMPTPEQSARIKAFTKLVLLVTASLPDHEAVNVLGKAYAWTCNNRREAQWETLPPDAAQKWAHELLDLEFSI